VRRRIAFGYGVVFALLVVVALWAIVNFLFLGRAASGILSENYRSILAAQAMTDALDRQDAAVLEGVAGRGAQAATTFRSLEPTFLEWLGRAKDNITIEGEADVVASIDAGYSDYRTQVAALLAAPGRVTADDAWTIYETRVATAYQKVRSPLLRLRDMNQQAMYAASDHAAWVARRAVWSTALVALAALVAAASLGALLARRIVGPIQRLSEASRRISAGDYDTRVPTDTGDELGRLGSDFNQMATQLARYHAVNVERLVAEKGKGDAVLASIEDGLIVFDTDLEVTNLNPAAARMLAVMSPFDALTCGKILPDGVCQALRQFLEEGSPPTVPDEQRIITVSAGERTRQLQYTITAVRGHDGAVGGAVLLLEDVTRLRELERLKTDFVMAASHELRTPLTSIGMSLGLLRERAGTRLGGEDRELLHAADEEVQRMTSLINDLLDLSRIESGSVALEYERVPVSLLFERVLEVFAHQAEARDVSLTSSAPPDLPAVRADATKIAWVLSNLVSNALRYVPRAGHVALGARRVGPKVHISVSDDGPGIPPQDHLKIFGKFVQVSGREPGGSGLGLAISKEIVRAHGGAIWVESGEGRGSTFTFTLPVAA